MKQITITTALAASLMTMAPAAHAMEFTGGNIALSFGQFSAPPNNQVAALNGAAGVTFGNGFGAQVDIDLQKRTGVNTDAVIGLHVFRAFSPRVTAGVYASYERDGDASLWSYYGVEAKVSPGSDSLPVSLEFALGIENDITGGGTLEMATVKASYMAGNQWDFSGKVTVYDFASPYSGLTLEAGRSFDSGMRVAGFFDTRIYSGSVNEERIGLKVSYEFGAGKVFGSRSFVGEFFGF